MIQVAIERIDKLKFTNESNLQVAPEQEAFIAEDIPGFVRHHSQDPKFECFLVKHENIPVGFFAIDLNMERHAAYIPEGQVVCVLRSFFIDKRFQGRGIAGQTLEQFGDFLRAIYPLQDKCFLTVNFKNAGAIRAYERAGFKKLEKPYLGGAAGPQYVMMKVFR